MTAQIRQISDTAASLSPAAAQALLQELRSLILGATGERLSRMFDGADDFLFEMSEKAGTNDQQRVYFDTMRAIRLGRANIGEHFEAQLGKTIDRSPASRSAAAEIDLEHLTLQDSEELEETIALSNMAGKAEGIYRNALWELDRRLEWLLRHSTLQLSPKAFAPSGFCDAFCASLKLLQIEFSIKLVLYKLFDRLVMGDLGALYTEILALFDRYGVQADKSAQAPPRPAAGAMPTPAASGATGAPSMPDLGNLPPLDPQTLQLLQQFGGMPGMPGMPGMSGAPGGMPGMPGGLAAGGTPGAGSYSGSLLGGGYADAVLASELVAAARGQSVQGLDPGHAWAMTQRAGLVGRMFNDIVADQNLPRGVTGALEALRFPVIKTALSDITFFSDPNHPVRSLVNDLGSMAAATRAGGAEAMGRFEELARKVKQQFDINAETVRPKAREAAPLEEGAIESFLDQQLAQGRERRKVIVEKVRKVVAQELELNTLAQPIPEAVDPLLRSGWGPMMAMRLLRHGHDSEIWRSGMELLHRVLFALNPKSPNARTQAEREALRRDLAVALAEVGMPESRIDSLLQGLDSALDDVEVEATRRPAAAEAPPMPAGSADPAPSAATDADPEQEQAPAPEVAVVPKPAADPEQLLEQLLVIGSWFRVYDRAHLDTRWLKVMSWYPQTQRVSFAEFDGKNVLTQHTRDLIEDLILGRSEPIDPVPSALHLLKALRESHHSAPAPSV